MYKKDLDDMIDDEDKSVGALSALVAPDLSFEAEKFNQK